MCSRVELRGGGLLNRGEDVGRRGGPQLGQARGALVLVLAAQVLVRLGAAPLLTRMLLRGHALLSLRIGRAGAGRILQDAAEGLRAVVRFLGRVTLKSTR